ncbi:peptidoglycan L-alanyl-D-glutamate endopeptidase CwlK [Geomicrobium halophilum]|uniref:Peptidoglycan L-alanyl-D-glutamate endopeptidase CwlK n=1 Tax=Geomicrobium halophilum TaxID=549000 RepID=A0A841PLA1_9BACL|nr:M15 family metallopeptidase [Geomicrobium halophilum]MBB6448464.1 peptidoglycan L-alanyl-D-glutamate endopeptidase CwlK [Geomicrobium halophilum]
MKLLFTILILSILFIAALNLDSLHDYKSEQQALAEEIVEVDGLHPYVEEQKNTLIERADEIGITVVITEGYRSVERQDELYDQGRTTSGDIVTNAEGGESYHNYGLAIDFAIENSEGRVIWDIEYDGNGSGEPDWFEVAAIGKELGFDWGGDWKGNRDYSHLQMDFGLLIAELQEAQQKAEQNNDV